MKKSSRSSKVLNFLSRILVRKIGIAILLLSSSAVAALSDGRHAATQIELKNCSGDGIAKIQLERKQRGGLWRKVRSYDFHASYGHDLLTNQAFCLDASKITLNNEPIFKTGDQARFRVETDAGNKANCDGTNYGKTRNGKNRLQTKMSGPLLNNGDCSPVRYKPALESNFCPGIGAIRTEQNC